MSVAFDRDEQGVLPMNQPYVSGNLGYVGGSYDAGNNGATLSAADYDAVKHSQVGQYQAKAQEYKDRLNLYTLICVIATLALIAGVFLAIGNANALWLLCAVSAIPPLVIFSRLRRTARKSKILLTQLTTLVLAVIDNPELSEADKKQQVLQIETNFLNNDDELYTKKFIWNAFLKYKKDKGILYGNFGLGGGQAMGAFHNSFANSMYIEPVWVNDGKGGGKWALAHPMFYVLKANNLEHLADRGWRADTLPGVNRVVEKLPPVWMAENPLELDNDDSDFVFLNWRIKRRIRDMFFAGDRKTAEVLADISEVAATSSVTFERMLRHKKISTKLKEFKRMANLVYLTPAAKMQLVSFVDGVLQDRPYVRQCDSMIDLMAAKNAQIDRYTQAFWKVHRRSLKFYIAEALWLCLIVPLFLMFVAAWAAWGFLPAAGLFVAGGAIIAFGQMAMMTRQIRDIEAKKLTPSLISSLVAIRHNMCAEQPALAPLEPLAGRRSLAESVATDERTYEYEQAFKAAEKRFMLTVTEVEAVKLAKDNVSDKVESRLSAPMINLRQNKEAQATIYYDKFNHYRRVCLKYGALEVFVMLLAIPMLTAVMAGSLMTGFIFVHFPLMLTGIGVALGLEAILLRNHIRVARRKELYLMVYQKMAVLLSNYKLFTDPVNIAIELHKLENSVIRAAEIDNMQDIAEHVSATAIVDLSADQAELVAAYRNYQTKKEIGANSTDTAQFSGNLTNLHQDFATLGTTE